MSTREPRIGDGKILAFNLLVWAVMLLASIVFIARFGSNVPSWDDWDQVPTATGHQPVTWEWLWSQHNEHRVPLPRLSFQPCHSAAGPRGQRPQASSRNGPRQQLVQRSSA